LDRAAYNGRIEALGPLLAMGARTDSENPRDTPFNSLIYAACNGKLVCAKYLIDNGGNLLKNTIECKGLFPSPISPENIKAARALQISALNGYPEPLIALIIATKKAAILAGPPWDT
jgi:ankyrin repeat protein